MSGRVLSGNSVAYYPQTDDKRQVLDIKETLDKFEEMLQHEDFPVASLKIEGESPRPLTKELAQALLQVANGLSQGKAVLVAPCDMMLTTQDAADMLGMSRPTFVKLLESGKIPYTKVGRHRRVRLDDLQEYDSCRHESFMQSMADLNRDTDPSLTAHNPLNRE